MFLGIIENPNICKWRYKKIIEILAAVEKCVALENTHTSPIERSFSKTPSPLGNSNLAFYFPLIFYPVMKEGQCDKMML